MVLTSFQQVRINAETETRRDIVRRLLDKKFGPLPADVRGRGRP